MASRVATQTEVPRQRRQSGVVIRAGNSWLGLVAATTKGVGEFARVRVKIRTTAIIQGEYFRLIVQSYPASVLAYNAPPHELGTPVASLQRAVSRDELRSGIDLDVMHVRTASRNPDEFVVFAWVEPGRPDLDFDAALARPSSGALRGSALSRRDPEQGFAAELLLTAA